MPAPVPLVAARSCDPKARLDRSGGGLAHFDRLHRYAAGIRRRACRARPRVEEARRDDASTRSSRTAIGVPCGWSLVWGAHRGRKATGRGGLRRPNPPHLSFGVIKHGLPPDRRLPPAGAGTLVDADTLARRTSTVPLTKTSGVGARPVFTCPWTWRGKAAWCPTGSSTSCFSKLRRTCSSAGLACP